MEQKGKSNSLFELLTLEDQATKLSCDHHICKQCWEDIHWIDDHQAQVADLLDVNIYTGNGGYAITPPNEAELTAVASGADNQGGSGTTTPGGSTTTTTTNTGSNSPISSGPLPMATSLPLAAPPRAQPSSPGLAHSHPQIQMRANRRESNIIDIDGVSYKRQLLLFRCPACDEFQLDRLRQYIWTDVTLAKAYERSGMLLYRFFLDLPFIQFLLFSLFVSFF